MTMYPAASDYFKAVQAPAHVFTVEKLQQARFAADMLGPIAARGTSAVVFRATVDQKQQAVRCFVRSDASSQERYGALGLYLADHDLKPYVEGATWLDKAIRVNGGTWPVLTMEWIDGRTLNEYVGFLVESENTAALSTLADRWRELVLLMQGIEFAHCDLQHGNVMVDQEGRLRLVDYDGVWIPQLAAMPAPTESGHPNYQHPGQQNGWGRWFDTFSALVIYLSLVALGKSTQIWYELYNSKNLLFSKTDFAAPFETPAWRLLGGIGDSEVDTLALQLQRCCAPDWVSHGSLEATLDVKPPLLSPPKPVPPTPSPAPPLVIKWWESTELPAPPPLSAPLGDTSMTKPRPVLKPAAAGQSDWWAAQRQQSTPPPPPKPMPSTPPTPTPPAPPSPAKPAQRQQQQIAGSIAVAVGIVFIFTGAANSHNAGGVVLLIIGLLGAAWGVWRLVTLGPKNTNPPGPPGPPAPPGPGARPY
jgi:eukaryotic-like serine/threonine-protein kinase